VGWYLMIPPASELPRSENGSITSALFSSHCCYLPTATVGQLMSLMTTGDEEPVFSADWITMASFEKLDECEAQISRLLKPFDGIKEKKASEVSPSISQRAMRYAAANCIATDDPRLK